jgi:hypothetical protein
MFQVGLVRNIYVDSSVLNADHNCISPIIAATHALQHQHSDKCLLDVTDDFIDLNSVLLQIWMDSNVYLYGSMFDTDKTAEKLLCGCGAAVADTGITTICKSHKLATHIQTSHNLRLMPQYVITNRTTYTELFAANGVIIFYIDNTLAENRQSLLDNLCLTMTANI